MNQIVIVVPFGDLRKEQNRTSQLEQFLNHFNALSKTINALSKTNIINVFIVIAEQISPRELFNRGQLINIGIYYYFEILKLKAKQIIMHDVDILPNKQLFAQYFKDNLSMNLIPLNKTNINAPYYKMIMAAGATVYSCTYTVFKKANGFPNTFYGWGAEDNAFDKRLKKTGIKNKVNTLGSFQSIDAQNKTQKHKMEYLKKNKLRNMIAWELLASDNENWTQNGYKQIESLNYTLVAKDVEYLDNITIYHIICELDITGYSDTKDAINKIEKK